MLIFLLIKKRTIESFENTVYFLYISKNITEVSLTDVAFLYKINGVHDERM